MTGLMRAEFPDESYPRPLAIGASRGDDGVVLVLARCAMDAAPVVTNADTGDIARVQPSQADMTPVSFSVGWTEQGRPQLPHDNVWIALLPPLAPTVESMRLLIAVDGRQHRCTLRWDPPPEPSVAPAPKPKRRS
jgi:hypothetical protein